MSCQRMVPSELPSPSQLLSFKSGSQIVLQHTTIMISQVHGAQSIVCLFTCFLFLFSFQKVWAGHPLPCSFYDFGTSTLFMLVKV